MSPWVKCLLLNYEDFPWALIASGLDTASIILSAQQRSAPARVTAPHFPCQDPWLFKVAITTAFRLGSWDPGP